MRLLFRFDNEYETYTSSHVITLSSNEIVLEESAYDRLKEYADSEDANSTLMVLDNDYGAEHFIRFDESIHVQGNVALFLAQYEVNGAEKLVSLTVHFNREKHSVSLELMTDNDIDNVCVLSCGRNAYFELNI